MPPLGGKRYVMIRTRRATMRESPGLLEKPLNEAADVLNVFRHEGGVNRQREHFLRGLLALWKIACAAAEPLETNLLVQRERIVNLGSDAVLLKIRFQLIAAFSPN